MSKPKVLIVDDQSGIRLLLSEILSQNGYATYTAATGPEALEKIKETTFDLVILDYQIPIIDGLSIVKFLDKNECPLPLIFMSGLPERLPVDPMVYDNIEKVVSKPFDIEELLTDIAAIIG